MTMLTEQEAKTKWCPLHEPGNAMIQMCRASACMAWRSEVVSLSHSDRDGEHPEIVLGYCGAFGRPA